MILKTGLGRTDVLGHAFFLLRYRLVPGSKYGATEIDLFVMWHEQLTAILWRGGHFRLLFSFGREPGAGQTRWFLYLRTMRDTRARFVSFPAILAANRAPVEIAEV